MRWLVTATSLDAITFQNKGTRAELITEDNPIFNGCKTPGQVHHQYTLFWRDSIKTHREIVKVIDIREIE